MPIYQRGSSTGNKLIDREFDRVYRFLTNTNAQSGSSESTVINPNTFFTDIGGFAVRVTNSSGILLSKGYLVKAASSSTGNNITICVENDFEAIGAVWEDIPAYGVGYIVINGWVDVFFNSVGSTATNYFRMSRDNDTINTDDGKAYSTSVNEVDITEYLGLVFEGRSGEGLARCIFKR